MSSLVRLVFAGVVQAVPKPNLLNNTKNVTCITAIRGIQSKATRCRHPVQKPKPFDYENKSYNLLTSAFDKTTHRLDQNSKIIVVEGPIAAGKTAFAKQLAEELDMLYLPEANLDMIYVNNYGFDLRKLDDQLPESCKTFDIDNFLVNPRHKKSASFQINQYIVKYSQYIDALAHVLSTGQGVILDRCVYSDFVFLESMYKEKYISRLARSAYYEMRQCTIDELMRPHLVIYLDIPVNKVRENIKKRNVSFEASSPALSDEYLATMEKYYKQHYLKNISSHAELLIYDWSAQGDIDIVVEDIERMQFKREDDHDTKFADWVYYLEEEWGCQRHLYADNKLQLMNYTNVPRYDVPEFVIAGDEAMDYYNLLDETPGCRYSPGFNADMGDKNILVKTEGKCRLTLPRRERRFPKKTV